MSIFFNTTFYLQNNPDVLQAILNGTIESAEEHFNTFGFREGRDPNPAFDVSFYLIENPDVLAARVNPLEHFINFGAAEGRSPSASFVAADQFDTSAYAAANPDLAMAGITTPAELYQHFATFGFSENRPGTVTVDGVEIGENGIPNPPEAPAEVFMLTASATAIDEGGSVFVTLETENVAAGTELSYTINGVQQADIVGPLTGIVTVDAQGRAVLQIDSIEDLLTEGEESIVITIAGEDVTVVLNDTSVSQAATLTLTDGADNIQGTDLNDTILAGSVQGSGVHTLGAADSINGGEGFDVLRIVEDRAPTFVPDGMGGVTAVPGTPGTLFPRMESVERVEIQSLTPGNIDFNNTTGIEQLVADRSIQDTAVTNLRDDVDFEFNSTAAAMNVGYSPIDMVNPTELNVAFNAAQGADLNLTNQGEGVATLNLTVNGGNTTFSDGANDITGVGGDAGALTEINLSGTSNVVIANQTNDNLTTNVNDVDATALTGTLNLNLLGQDAGNNLTFVGGDADTRLVVSAGDNNITFGMGDDLLILSSNGLNGSDIIDGGAGENALEVHYNNTNTSNLDANSGTYAALAAAQNIQTLVVDVWNQDQGALNANSAENVTIDQALLTGVTSVVIQDTSLDEDNALVPNSGNGIRDDQVGNINLANVAAGIAYTVLANNIGTIAAAGSELNLTIEGVDVEGQTDDVVAGMDLTGLTGAANITINNVDAVIVDESTNGSFVGTKTYETTAGETDLGFVEMANGGELNIDGSADRFAVELAAAEDVTVNASGMMTEVGAGNVINAGQVLRANITGTDQADVILAGLDDDTIDAGEGDNIVVAGEGDNVVTAGAGNDDITSGAGDDDINAGDGNNVINAGDGNNVVVTGSGNDEVTVGEGVQDISTGAGDDVAIFESLNANNLTSADSYDGGEGRDTLRIDAPFVDLADGVFNQVTNVEILDMAGDFARVVFNQIANDRAFDTVNFAGGFNQLEINEGFDKDLTVNLSNGDDQITIDAGSMTSLTVNVDADDLNGGDVITAGVSMQDVLNVTVVDGATADLVSVTGVETLNIVDNGNLIADDTTVILGSDADLTTVDGSGVEENLTIDASASASMNLSIATGSGADRITASANGNTISAGAGADVVFSGAGADIIDLGEGDDTVQSSEGADVLTGGEGADIFVYTQLLHSSALIVDTITDFVSGEDQIQISTALTGGAPVVFVGNANSFGQASGAVTNGSGSIQIIFQADTNTLWADLNDDGTLNADDLQIVLSGVTTLAAGDVVELVNAAPTAVDDMFNVLEDDGLAVIGSVTANDNDFETASVDLIVSEVDGDTLNVGNSVAGSAGGQFTIAANGDVSFDTFGDFEALAAGETVDTTVTYTVADAGGLENSATVTVTVTGQNDAPVAMVDVAAVNEDDLPIMGDVSANDMDVDNGAVLTYTLDAPVDGLTLNADGTYTFDAGDAAYQALADGEVQNVIASYTVTDELGATDTSTLTITVTGVNDAPVAVADVNAILEDAVTGGNVGSNDTDVDNSAVLTYTLNAPVAGLTLNANGGYSFDAGNAAYQALADGETQDVVANYTVTDDQGATDTSTLTITVTGVNDAPVAVADVNAVNEDAMVMGDVSTNDTDIDNGAVLTYTLDAPVDGLTLNADGTYTFDAGDAAYQALAQGQVQNVVANYTVEDEFGATDTSALTITVTGVNDAPVAVADTAMVDEDAMVMGDVSTNDTDVDNGAMLTFALNAPVAGLMLNANGTFTFDASDAAYQSLADGETLDVVAAYTVTDEFGGTDTADLTITVTGVDDALVVGPVDAGAVNEFVFTATDVDSNINLVTPFNGVTAINNGTPTTLTAIQQGVAETTLIEVESDGQMATEVVGTLIEGTAGMDTVNPVVGSDPMLVATFGGNDTIMTGDGDDIIFGGDGDDSIVGGDGDDYIVGGDGIDVLTGGLGSDTFVYLSSSDAPDSAVLPIEEITDFQVGTDTIDLSVASFGLLGTFADLGNLANYAAGFAAAQAEIAANPSEIVFFNDGTDGYLLIDLDLDGGAPDMSIQLTGVTAGVTAGDFIV